MNSLNLRHRLLLITLLPSGLIAIILVFHFTITAIHTLQTELQAKGTATVRYLAPVSEYGILTGQNEALQALTQAALLEPGSKAATVVNNKGRTLAISGRLSLGAEQLREIPGKPGIIAETQQWIAFAAPVVRSLEERDPLFDSLTGDGSKTSDILGCVFIEFDKRELQEQEYRLWREGALIIGCGLLILGLIAVAIADGIAKPVRRLVTAIENITQGNFATRVPSDTHGEIGILERGFNEMATHIEEGHHSMLSRIEEATANLAHQARHDALTGLINRREFEQRLERALTSVQAGGEGQCLLFISLDSFRTVNETCGYLAGDELLRQITMLIEERLNDEDLLSRIGWSEFGLLLSGKPKRAHQLAQQLCATANEYRFIWQEKVFLVDLSIGIAPLKRDTPNIGHILAGADAACREAHRQGRNRIAEQQPELRSGRFDDQPNWNELIAEGLAGNRLLIEAIPLQALSDNVERIPHVEIGARFNLPGQPPIALAALLEVAEQHDLGGQIDRRLIECALNALSQARTRQHRLCCLVPISRGSINHPETLHFLAQGLSERRLNGRSLVLLIQEELLAGMTSQVMSFAREAHHFSIRIGLEDFGGGLSSFGHLRGIQPDFIKLSASLSRDFEKNRSSTALLNAIREIASDQGIQLIAEGINNLAMFERIRNLGVDFIQGLAVAPREPFDAWLEGAVMRLGNNIAETL